VGLKIISVKRLKADNAVIKVRKKSLMQDISVAIKQSEQNKLENSGESLKILASSYNLTTRRKKIISPACVII